MTQKNIIIGLVGLVAIFLLLNLTNNHGGWGMMGSFRDDMHEEMEEHMHNDDNHEHEDGDGHFHNEMGEHMHDEASVGTPTSADNAPEGSMHNLPVPEAVRAVKELVASELNIGTGTVIVMSAYEKDWSDSCLGLGGPAESCLFAITPGYEVTVLVQGNERVFRTNADGTIIREENDSN